MPAGSALYDFGANGFQIACREHTIDERAVKPWMNWLRQPTPTLIDLNPNATILDVGAHIGGFTLLAAAISPAGRVLAVEACLENYEMLAYNVQLNRLARVETEHLALSDRPGEVSLHHNPAGNWGHTITKPVGGHAESVRAETLADYLRSHAVERCDLAKLNCEGAEFPILMSTSVETLRKIRQMLVFYHADLVDSSYSVKKLEQHLETAGFRIERREQGPSRGRILARLLSKSDSLR